jgi:hypothetical protein
MWSVLMPISARPSLWSVWVFPFAGTGNDVLSHDLR